MTILRWSWTLRMVHIDYSMWPCNNSYTCWGFSNLQSIQNLQKYFTVCKCEFLILFKKQNKKQTMTGKFWIGRVLFSILIQRSYRSVLLYCPWNAMQNKFDIFSKLFGKSNKCDLSRIVWQFSSLLQRKTKINTTETEKSKCWRSSLKFRHARIPLLWTWWCMRLVVAVAPIAV